MKQDNAVKERKGGMMNIRFKPETYQLLKERAKLAGLSVAAFIVYLVVKALQHGL
ncbi:MAG: hypothetical protein [Bacteriophage sp.]|nr:MAG: hypothetical protein [Bacteriophage sp.]